MSSKADWASRPVHQPEPGYFEMRLVRGGPYVTARIIHDEDGWHAVIDGQRFAPHHDPEHSEPVFRIWHRGGVISEAEYFRRLDRKAAAIKANPAHPAAHPYQPIDLTQQPSLY